MIYHQRQHHIERERLAWKVRCLVARSYKRAADRQWMRDQGFEVPDAIPGSWEAFEDRVYRTYCRADERPNLRVLEGGLGGNTSARLERRHLRGPEASTAAVGDKPPAIAGEQLSGLPTNFDTEGESA